MNPFVYCAYKFEVVCDITDRVWQILTPRWFQAIYELQSNNKIPFVNNSTLHWKDKTVNRWHWASKALYLCLPFDFASLNRVACSCIGSCKALNTRGGVGRGRDLLIKVFSWVFVVSPNGKSLNIRWWLYQKHTWPYSCYRINWYPFHMPTFLGKSPGRRVWPAVKTLHNIPFTYRSVLKIKGTISQDVSWW